MNYYEKLKDPRWQKRRLEILDRDGWSCRRCKDRIKELHVHHVYYEKGFDPWDYNDDMLITLCVECHKWIDIENKKMMTGLVNAIDKTMPSEKYPLLMLNDLVFCYLSYGLARSMIENIIARAYFKAYKSTNTEYPIDHFAAHSLCVDISDINSWIDELSEAEQITNKLTKQNE
jgi:hypothetical protein